MIYFLFYIGFFNDSVVFARTVKRSPSSSAKSLFLFESPEIKKLRKQHAQEIQTLKDENKVALLELKKQNKAFLKDWNASEIKARHQFFAEHERGQERRAYIQDFLRRRKELFISLDQKKQALIQQNNQRIQDLKQKQEAELKHLQDQL